MTTLGRDRTCVFTFGLLLAGNLFMIETELDVTDASLLDKQAPQHTLHTDPV